MKYLLSFLSLCGFLALSVMPLSGQAQEWPTDDTAPEPEKPGLLQQLEKIGTQVFYMGVYEGINGWMIVQKGIPTYFYQAPDTNSLIQGIIYDANGKNITAHQLQNLQFREGEIFSELIKPLDTQKLLEAQRKLAQGEQVDVSTQNQADVNVQAQSGQQQPTQPSSPAQRLYGSFENSNWVPLGNSGAPFIYAVIDPNCPHCQGMLDQVKPLLDSNRLQVRMVPIGFNESSKKVGAIMLASAEPKDVIYNYINGQKPAGFNNEGLSVAAIDENVSLVREWALDATPFSVYQNKNGEIKLIRGIPDDLGSLLTELR